MSNVLVDTSAWIEFFRPQGNEGMRHRIAQLIDDNEAALCGIVLAELLRGTRSDREYRDLQDRLLTLHYVDTPEYVWVRAGHLGNQLTRKGAVVPTTDLIIACVAMSNGLTLLHQDRHFPLIAKHASLKVIIP